MQLFAGSKLSGTCTIMVTRPSSPVSKAMVLVAGDETLAGGDGAVRLHVERAPNGHHAALPINLMKSQRGT